MQHFMARGRLCTDPVTKMGKEVKQYTAFTMAIPRYGKEAEADFIRAVTFEKNSEFVQAYLKKGMEVEVMGEIRTGFREKGEMIIPTAALIVSRIVLAGQKENNGSYLFQTENERDTFMDYEDD